MKTVIIKYNAGNIRSVLFALERIAQLAWQVARGLARRPRGADRPGEPARRPLRGELARDPLRVDLGAGALDRLEAPFGGGQPGLEVVDARVGRGPAAGDAQPGPGDEQRPRLHAAIVCRAVGRRPRPGRFFAPAHQRAYHRRP